MRLIDADLINRDTFSDCENATECVYAIGNIPTAEVQTVVHGKWLDVTDNSYWGTVFKCECSICGYIDKESDKTTYCPHCAARMDGDINDT